MAEEQLLLEPKLKLGDNYDSAVELSKLVRELDIKVNNLRNNFIYVGYYLKQINNNEVLTDLGYKDVYEFAEEKYGFKKTSTKNFIAVYEKFGIEKLENYFVDPVKKEYSNYSFSQLVELIPEKEGLDNYDPKQTIKEIRLTKLSKKIDADKSSLENWFKVSLFNQISEVIKDYVGLKISYKENLKAISLTSKLIKYIYFEICLDISYLKVSYSISREYKSVNVAFSYKLVEKYLKSFLNQYKKLIDENKKLAEEEVKKVDEKKSSSQTSDQEKEINQTLKNETARYDYVANEENYILLEKYSNNLVRFYRLNKTPFVLIALFSKGYSETYSNDFRKLGFYKFSVDGLFDNVSCYDARDVVAWLKDNKI